MSYGRLGANLYALLLRRPDNTCTMYPLVDERQERLESYRLQVLKERDERGEYQHGDLLTVVRIVEGV